MQGQICVTRGTVFAVDCPADVQQPKWYVLFVRSNQEKRVADALRGRDIEYFLPSYKSVRQWKDRRVTLEIPLFPGYVFLRLPLAERARALSVANVVSLVGTRNQPSAISDEEIAWIRLGIEHGNAEPYPYLKVGQRVVVTEGVLCGMQGILERKRNNSRVVVSLDSIARAFVVEIDASWVRPVGVHSGTSAASADETAVVSAAAAGSYVPDLRREMYSLGA
jgi:transcription antitermination factor NusG